MTATVDDIDAFLATAKRLFGQPVWVESGTRATLSASLLDPGGRVIGGASLRLTALVRLPAPQRGSAVLIFAERPVQRLSFRPDHPHANPARQTIPPALRSLKLPPERSRVYRWADDRCWPRLEGAGVGAPVEPEPATLDDAFAQFLSLCAIAGSLPPPPHRPTLEF